eukprot:9467100-Pyramimonas_sp.AAC.1
MEAKRKELMLKRGQGGPRNSEILSVAQAVNAVRSNSKTSAKGAPATSAARSHEMNDAYMSRMDDAFAQMAIANKSTGARQPGKVPRVDKSLDTSTEITCMSVNEQKVVVGSCDHALYEFGMDTG